MRYGCIRSLMIVWFFYDDQDLCHFLESYPFSAYIIRIWLCIPSRVHSENLTICFYLWNPRRGFLRLAALYRRRLLKLGKRPKNWLVLNILDLPISTHGYPVALRSGFMWMNLQPPSKLVKMWEGHHLLQSKHLAGTAQDVTLLTFHLLALCFIELA